MWRPLQNDATQVAASLATFCIYLPLRLISIPARLFAFANLKWKENKFPLNISKIRKRKGNVAQYASKYSISTVRFWWISYTKGLFTSIEMNSPWKWVLYWFSKRIAFAWCDTKTAKYKFQFLFSLHFLCLSVNRPSDCKYMDPYAELRAFSKRTKTPVFRFCVAFF